mmetsp:Transcript_11007/g.25151  ORF Transcript_11007/g.25151 Transcript_11007/m.25151 type:complete len:631 (-) Transcript_11007:154-2046(-)
MAASAPVIDPARVKVLRDGVPKPQAAYVLLWVQQDVRAICNHALEYAILEANKLQLPVLACYGLYEKFPNATERAFSFLLQGLQDLSLHLRRRHIRFVCKRVPPPVAVQELADGAALIVTDRGYARICRQWRKEVAAAVPDCRLVQVESNVVVPVELVSNAAEPAAATLRPKIHRLLPRFLVPCQEIEVVCKAADLSLPSHMVSNTVNVEAAAEVLAALDVDRSVVALPAWIGGASEGERRLDAFLPKLGGYGTGKANDPTVQGNSFLSPYLHFGHLSPIDIALKVKNAPLASTPGTNRFTLGRQAATIPDSSGRSGAEAFLEELIIRRELARNFCNFNDHYDSLECLPAWARASLEQHRVDARHASYTELQLARGETNDPWWNAAQWELVATGHMHNYLRMYWAKQLLLWAHDPQVAFKQAIWLNDRFSLDGRDENGYMGIAWCFGLHDRPFPDRPIFGEIRPMTRKGIEGKFNMQRYRELVQRKCRVAIREEPRIRESLPDVAFGGTSEGGLTTIFFAQAKAKKDMVGNDDEGIEKEMTICDADCEVVVLPTGDKHKGVFATPECVGKKRVPVASEADPREIGKRSKAGDGNSSRRSTQQQAVMSIADMPKRKNTLHQFFHGKAGTDS